MVPWPLIYSNSCPICDSALRITDRQSPRSSAILPETAACWENPSPVASPDFETRKHMKTYENHLIWNHPTYENRNQDPLGIKDGSGGRVFGDILCETPAFAISISHSIHRGHKVRAAEICQQISTGQNDSKTLEVNLHGTRNALVGFPQKIGLSHVQAQHFFTRHIWTDQCQGVRNKIQLQNTVSAKWQRAPGAKNVDIPWRYSTRDCPKLRHLWSPESTGSSS